MDPYEVEALLLRAFTPEAVAEIGEETRARVGSLVDRTSEQDVLSAFEGAFGSGVVDARVDEVTRVVDDLVDRADRAEQVAAEQQAEDQPEDEPAESVDEVFAALGAAAGADVVEAITPLMDQVTAETVWEVWEQIKPIILAEVAENPAQWQGEAGASALWTASYQALCEALEGYLGAVGAEGGFAVDLTS
ncbi:hypothetical protein [Actinokineospora bangkokensis]|uniref:DUF2267 domain-containing protein n=1 Tax=Actinokineospora bangkokensis TaxID=1193682 RepID=A0A1Q9LST9_9PSEU|nr:hypothetical protein [Actinokineospora bangkokensis]OLR95054.1 hypothetical protein BJP25_08875 [Actinokineospora bangkokensis]